MSLGNIYPNYDALQLLVGWEFYLFRSVGVNVCKKNSRCVYSDNVNLGI